MTEEPVRPRTKDRPEVMAVMRTVAVRVASLRQERGLSVRELATRCDLSTNLIWRVEHPKGDIQLGTLVVIAEQLGVDVSAFLSD